MVIEKKKKKCLGMKGRVDGHLSLWFEVFKDVALP